MKCIVVSEQRYPYLKINIDITDDIDIKREKSVQTKLERYHFLPIPKLRKQPDSDSEWSSDDEEDERSDYSSDNDSMDSDNEYVPPRENRNEARERQFQSELMFNFESRFNIFLLKISISLIYY